MKHEYAVLHVESDLQTALNDMAAQGWRLAHINITSPATFWTCIFEREVIDGSKAKTAKRN